MKTMPCAYCGKTFAFPDGFVKPYSATCWLCWLFQRSRTRSLWKRTRGAVREEHEMRNAT